MRSVATGDLRRGINFHPIAGREQKRLGAAGFLAQLPIDRSVPDEALARLNGCRVMAEANAEKFFHSVWVDDRNVIPQSNVSAALKATTQSAAIRRGAVVPKWRASRMAA